MCEKKERKIRMKMKIFLSYNNNYNNYLIKNAVASLAACSGGFLLDFSLLP